MDLQEMIKTINDFKNNKNITILNLQLLIIDTLTTNKDIKKNLKLLINNITKYNKNEFKIYNDEIKNKKILNLYCNILNYNINIEPFIKSLDDFNKLETLEEIKKI